MPLSGEDQFFMALLCTCVGVRSTVLYSRYHVISHCISYNFPSLQEEESFYIGAVNCVQAKVSICACVCVHVCVHVCLSVEPAVLSRVRRMESSGAASSVSQESTTASTAPLTLEAGNHRGTNHSPSQPNYEEVVYTGKEKCY